MLKANGLLIDIHPVAEHSSVEIHRNGNIDRVGYLEVPQWCVDFQQADNALAKIVQRRQFTVEQKSMFDTLTYYDSAAEMGTAIKESIHTYARDAQSGEEAVPHAEALVAHVEELMRAAGPGAELIMRERNHISRLKPA